MEPYNNLNRILPYATQTLNSGRTLVTGYFGGWAILSADELQSLKNGTFLNDDSLTEKLSNAGITATESNIASIAKRYASLNSNLFQKPSLHIINLTNTCNYRCKYCHAGVSRGSMQMNAGTARKAAAFILQNSGDKINIEFQGGESLLNFDALAATVEEVKKLNSGIHRLSRKLHPDAGAALLARRYHSSNDRSSPDGANPLTFGKQSTESLALKGGTGDYEEFSTEPIHRKEVNICIVSNLSLLDDEKLDYLLDNNISICTSIDGPAQVHDSNRKTIDGDGTLRQTIDKVKWARRRMIEKWKTENTGNQMIGALCTVTRKSLDHAGEIIDLYLENDLTTIHLRPLNNMGDATASWNELSYTPEEFNSFWSKAMDRIIEHNKHGNKIIERGAHFIIMKILGGRDPQYTEMMSPCGAGRIQILYNPDGSIYTCDEGRMINEELFKIGSLPGCLREPRFGSLSGDGVICGDESIIGGDESINIWASSILDLSCYFCAYRPWCGTCPVANYNSTKNIVPNITTNFLHKIYHHQFTYIFNKIDSDPEALEIFKKWADF